MRHHAPPDTLAARALARWVDQPGNSQGSLARSLEISQPAVSQWIRGNARPEPHLRIAIELITAIPAADWDTDDERALVDRVRAQLDDAAPAPTAPPPTVRKATTTRTKTARAARPTLPRKRSAA